MAELNYFRPTPDEYEEHSDRLMEVPRGESVKRSLARTDITYFSVNNLRFKPYFWQSKLWDSLTQGHNVIVCSGRQQGKTAALSIFALHACTFNTMPLHTTKKTRIVIVSKSIDQSKKVIADVKEWMRVGDDVVREITKGKVENYFTSLLDKGKNAANNKGAITFANGCEIISLPPTDSARGYTASILFLDEAAFFSDADIYNQTLAPIVSQTGNRICMTSTPNGQQGFFYDYFDPDNRHKEHSFKRMWVPYTSLDMDAPQMVEERDAKRREMYAQGHERQFEQEYMASFNASNESFFKSSHIDDAVSELHYEEQEYKRDCDLAVDFGVGKYSETVITISTLENPSNPTIRLLYQRTYQPEKELTLIEDIQELMRRFNIQRIIFEECAAAEPYRQQAVKAGLPIHMFVPARDKNKKYYALKSWFALNKVIIPEGMDKLTRQLKGMVYEKTPTREKIHHGAGLLDDMADSFMMSTIFYTESGAGGFKVWSYDDL